MHHVPVACALTTKSGVAEDECLLGSLHDPLRARQRTGLVGLLELVNNHRSDRPCEAVADRLVGPEARPRLTDEHDADTAGARSLNEVDCGVRPVRQLRELVDDDDCSPVTRLARQRPGLATMAVVRRRLGACRRCRRPRCVGGLLGDVGAHLARGQA